MNKKLKLSLVASCLIATNLLSNDNLDNLSITSSIINTDEIKSTFSSEIYTKKDIEDTNAKDIYEFLGSQTTVNVSPNFGNTFAQKIDLRGYGLGDGYQNLVVTVNGRRLNNIDLQPQLLSSIPLESIEKIEIIRGSGSVKHGDGANSGVINIITNGKNENYLKTYFGTTGQKHATLSVGHLHEKFILNALVDYTYEDGARITSASNTDVKRNNNQSANLIYFPSDKIELRVGKTYTDMDIKYGGSINLADYKDNTSKASSLSNQLLKSNVTSAGFTSTYSLGQTIDINFNRENKTSQFVGSAKTIYDYKSYSFVSETKKDDYILALGVDIFDGVAKKASNDTTKRNSAFFVSSEYNITDDLKTTIGARSENVKYNHTSSTNASYDKVVKLNAFDLGFNYTFNQSNSMFINYNKSYQAPDIDRFFSSSWSNASGTWVQSISGFNGFIEPAKVHNYSIGYNNIQKQNKLKVSLFRANLKDEIYLYDPDSTRTNTNIDRSHKYGLELFDNYKINKNFATSINYSYIVAKIDEENENNGAYNNKYLPGLSKHNVTVNLMYKTEKTNMTLSHTYRSSTFAANDFENNFSQKQEAYNSTDLSISYKADKNLELFSKVQNLLDEKNAIWIKDDAIYPLNFERSFYAGMKVKF
jgi:iron complex outermembrane receptor protein